MIDRNMTGRLFSHNVVDPFHYVTSTRRMLFMNYNLPEEIPSVSGFFSMRVKSALDVHALLYSDQGLPEQLADFVGVSQITSSNMFEWVGRPNFMPLITAGQGPVFAASDSTLSGLTNAAFDPRATVYLPLEARAAVSAVQPTRAQVTMRSFSAHKIEAEVVAPQASMVVVAQAYYHPWHAYVDGRQVPLWRANHAFQALQVPAGSHKVELRYEDAGFRVGAAVSLFSCLLIARMWWRFGPMDPTPVV
jgi:hypothetical protein